MQAGRITRCMTGVMFILAYLVMVLPGSSQDNSLDRIIGPQFRIVVVPPGQNAKFLEKNVREAFVPMPASEFEKLRKTATPNSQLRFIPALTQASYQGDWKDNGIVGKAKWVFNSTSKNQTYFPISPLNIAIKKAYIDLIPGQQKYNLMSASVNVETSASFTTMFSGSSTIDVVKVYHEATPAIQRFFDPYSVGGQGTLNLLDEMGFGSYSPAAQFLLMPLYEDILRIQAIELNDHIRKSHHSFNIVNNVIEVFPLPKEGFGTTRLYFDYMSRDSFEQDSQTIQANSLSDYSDIPYDFIQYSNINDVGKQWVRKYTLALSKELLGAIREKYSSIPIPDADISLDGAALRAEAQVEKDALILQLRENLEELGRKNQFEIRKNEAEYHQDMLRKIPLKLYVG